MHEAKWLDLDEGDNFMKLSLTTGLFGGICLIWVLTCTKIKPNSCGEKDAWERVKRVKQKLFMISKETFGNVWRCKLLIQMKLSALFSQIKYQNFAWYSQSYVSNFSLLIFGIASMQNFKTQDREHIQKSKVTLKLLHRSKKVGKGESKMMR